MAPPQLTPEQAKSALTEIFSRFQKEENKLRFEALVKECEAEENPMMAKMQKFPPLVTEVLKDLMESLGFQESELMMGVMQIQMHAAKDPDMSSKVGILMQAFTGNIPAPAATEEAEMCD